MLICFNGVDGAGKSTQALRLVEQLNEQGYPAAYRWCGSRTPLTRPLTKRVKRWLGGEPESAARPVARQGESAYLQSTQRLLGGAGARTVWLTFTLYEHAFKIWWSVVPLLARGHIVVCDRYLYDSIVTTALLAGVAPDALPPLLRLPPGCHVPPPQHWFFLDLPVEVAMRRKAELHDHALLERRILLYQSAAHALGMQRVDATLPPEQVAALIWQSIHASLRQPA